MLTTHVTTSRQQLTLLSFKDSPMTLEHPLPIHLRNFSKKGAYRLRSDKSTLLFSNCTDVYWVGGWWGRQGKLQKTNKQTNIQQQITSKMSRSSARILKGKRLCFWIIRGILWSQNTAKIGKRSYLKFFSSSMGRKEKIPSLTLPD